jgi:hypothetical protein
MSIKDWFKTPRTMDADLDVTQVVEWSLRCAQDNDDLFPAWCSGSMNCTALWYAMPVMVALKYKGLRPPLPNFLLDEIEPGITRAVHESLFGEHTNDDELQEVKVLLSQYTRHVIDFWLTAFDEFSAQRYFGDQQVLAEMLTGLIENPNYGLADQLGVEDEDDLAALSDALAAHIKACHARVFELTSPDL